LRSAPSSDLLQLGGVGCLEARPCAFEKRADRAEDVGRRSLELRRVLGRESRNRRKAVRRPELDLELRAERGEIGPWLRVRAVVWSYNGWPACGVGGRAAVQPSAKDLSDIFAGAVEGAASERRAARLRDDETIVDVEIADDVELVLGPVSLDGPE